MMEKELRFLIKCLEEDADWYDKSADDVEKEMPYSARYLRGTANATRSAAKRIKRILEEENHD